MTPDRQAFRDAIYAGTLPFDYGRARWSGMGQYDIGNWRRRVEAWDTMPAPIVAELARLAAPFDDRDDYAGGTRCVLDRVTELRAAHIHQAFNEDTIRSTAERSARAARRLKTLAEREEIARKLDVEPPAPPPEKAHARGDRPQMNRLGCERWWRRALRRCWTRRAEEAMRSLGLISRRRAGYCSDTAVRWRRVSQRNAGEFLKRHALENADTAEQLELLAVASRSISNPAIRRGELMVRVKGFEELAAEMRHVARFFTLTCPSAFHRTLVSGDENPRWEEGKSIREAQLWLRRTWARCRAELARRNIHPYGVRVAEPHHDGTPHWHMLLFVNQARAADLERVLKDYWLSEFSDEPGARDHRVTCEAISSAKGSAVGYVAKYVSKNLDAHGAIADETDDETDLAVADAAERVRTWASVHGIRQFQQIGGPAVTLYRECRREREPVADPIIERARAAADAGDWAAFCKSLGPFFQREKAIRLEKELWGHLNAYDELVPAQIVGIRSGSAFINTRPHTWRIVKCTLPQFSGALSSSLTSQASPPLSARLSSGSPSRSETRSASDELASAIPSSTVPRSPSIAPYSGESRTCAQGASRLPASRHRVRSPVWETPGVGRTITSWAGAENLSSSFPAPRSARRLGPVAITVRAVDHNDPELMNDFLRLWALVKGDGGGSA